MSSWKLNQLSIEWRAVKSHLSHCFYSIFRQFEILLCYWALLHVFVKLINENIFKFLGFIILHANKNTKKNIFTSLYEIDKCNKISTNKLDCQIIISLIFFCHNVQKFMLKMKNLLPIIYSEKKSLDITYREIPVSYPPRSNIFGYVFCYMFMTFMTK